MIRGKESTLKGLSSLAYKKPIHSRDNYVLVADNNGTRIYRDYHNNDYAVIERGTQSLSDIATNIHAAISGLKNTTRFKNSKQFVENFAKKNNLDPSTFTYSGHSLGAALATTLGDHFKSNKITSFNPPLYKDVPLKGKLFIGEDDFITKPSAFLFNRKIKDPTIIPNASHTLDNIPDAFN